MTLSAFYQPCIGDAKAASKRLHHATLLYKSVELTVAYTAQPYSSDPDWSPEAHIVSVTVGRECVDVARLVAVEELEMALDEQLLGRGE